MGFWPRGLLLSDCTWGCRLNCADPRGSRKTPRAEAPCGPAASPSSADSGLCLLQSASSHPQSQAVAHTKKGMLETPESSGLSALSLESAEDLCQGLLGAMHWYPDTSHSLGMDCEARSSVWGPSVSKEGLRHPRELTSLCHRGRWGAVWAVALR